MSFTFMSILHKNSYNLTHKHENRPIIRQLIRLDNKFEFINKRLHHCILIKPPILCKVFNY